MSTTVDYDVVIVGAGIAGLTAARELRKQASDLKILVLEAKDRVGGRTLTTTLNTANNTKDKFDLGGQWVGRTQTHILNLLQELGLSTYEQYDEGAKWAQLGSPTPKKFSGSLPIKQLSISEIIDTSLCIYKIERLSKKIDLHDLFKSEDSRRYDSMTLAEWTEQNCYTRAAQDAVDLAVRSLYGTEPNRMSVLNHLIYSKSAGSFTNLLETTGDGAQSMRVKNGTQQICEILAAQLGDSVVLRKAVKRVHIDEDNMSTLLYVTDLKENNGILETISCSRVILAIPPNQCAKIEFSPRLPVIKQRLFETSHPGHYLKFVMTFETAFWRKNGLSGEIISTGRSEIPGEILPVQLAYDATSGNGSPAIIGFIDEIYTDISKDERCKLVVKDLTRFFGKDVTDQFIDYDDKVWVHEEYNGGCPVDLVSPGNTDAFQTIREPFKTVHFAGTETAFQWMGYMSGAVESGLRTAHEVLFCYKRNCVVQAYLKGSIYADDYQKPLTPASHYISKHCSLVHRVFLVVAVSAGIYFYNKKYNTSSIAKAIQSIHELFSR